MDEFSPSSLLGDILHVLHLDITAIPDPGRFPCRPLCAFTYERTTALGRFHGNIGLPDLKDFSMALNELLTEKVQKVILDFSSVTLSKTAIGAFLSFAAAIFGLNKRLYIYQASDQVKTALQDLGVKKFFAFIETEDDVVATIVL